MGMDVGNAFFDLRSLLSRRKEKGRAVKRLAHASCMIPPVISSHLRCEPLYIPACCTNIGYANMPMSDKEVPYTRLVNFVRER